MILVFLYFGVSSESVLELDILSVVASLFFDLGFISLSSDFGGFVAPFIGNGIGFAVSVSAR